ncbi:MAG: mucoidy inhibitor MuiA family protein [Candidatus Edwardsbacteria bacterium]|nr:mucoidy inhibitor MuiA family protein [Candidatus Edwardsbacteria bacterium]MBU1576998.1 mucoidy inhibitor MuiA family protein [Candidatus Edwardsbacteria bacterium]MBU2464120.1 mucoidy inhibitor MuiA family protein [Candidatus Edwardsbacteria bacterium]MBU2594825.1 mucoidy inhibitor MuiA family protein [Candidatus Edwardsbacteria bacterium]
MKKITLISALVLIAVSAFALQTIEQKTPISQVVIYNDRVEITRMHKTGYQPGEYQFKMTDLPSSLDENSVRASGSGTAEVKINGVKIETVYLDTTTNQKYKALEDSVEQLKEQQKIYDDRYSLLQKEADYLEKIKNASTAVPSGRESEKPKSTTVSEWTGLYNFYDAKFEAINKEQRNIEKSKKVLQAKLNALQNRLHKISAGANLTKKNVSVSFTVKKEGSLALSLSYMMMGASWHPQYDIRVSPENKEVEFTYYGVIYQNTGEDWKNVKVTLSTAQPSISGAMPALKPWYVDVYQQYYQKGQASQRAKQNIAYSKQMQQAPAEQIAITGGFNAEYGEAASGVVNTSLSTSDVEFTGTSYVYQTPGENNIPSDGEPHKIPIAFETLKADFEYSSAPRLKQYAYLQGKVKNSTEYPFIAGDINVFFGNNFVGSSAINTVIPSEKFDVSLGIDEGIKITRQKVKDLTEGSKKIKKTYGYKVTVKNLKKTKEILTVNEQYPVSRNDKIKVKLVSPKFDDEKLEFGIKEKANGLIEWKMELGPQEKTEMELEYILEYPSGVSVTGL